MQRPLRITSRDFELTPAMEKDIRKRVASLEKYFDRVSGCEVTVEAPVHHHRKGGPFRVHVRLTVPRGEIIEVNRQAKDDLAVALREAFDAARRRLEDHARELDRRVKTHVAAPRGRVTKLVPKEGYGFLTTAEGDEIYFHRNSVLASGFDRLEIGSEVRFDQELGEQGPQASSVTIVKPRKLSRLSRTPRTSAAQSRD